MKNIPLKIHPADVALASFERSGNSWVRAILTALIIKYEKLETKFDYPALADIIPFDRSLYYQVGSRRDVAARFTVFPRIIKTHNTFLKKYRRSIYVLRDPRDVMVSFYLFSKYRNKLKIFDFSKFFRYSVIDWCKHVDSWRGEAGVIVTYENMQADPAKEMVRILNYLKIKIKAEDIKNAVKQAAFGEMVKLEKKFKKKSGEEYDDRRTFVIRSGKSMQWKEYVGKEDLDFLNKQIKKHRLNNFLKKYGYVF